MPATLSAFPLAKADQCVKCGLCLPHCPTYALTQHEADSPRGRIALMQGLATGLIAPTAALEQHLDGCLSCRSCEPVCPAKVPYGELMDAGRAILQQQQPQRSTRLRRVIPWLAQRNRRRLWLPLLCLYQRSGAQSLLRRAQFFGAHRLARLDSLLPNLRLRWPQSLPTTATPADAHLFVGCTGDWADRDTLNALHFIARKLDKSLHIPSQQVCCGALHQHAGLVDDFSRQQTQNLAAFGTASTPILTIASGCAASLRDYDAHFSTRVADACAWVLSNWPDDLSVHPLQKRVAVYTPCTQRNVIKQAQATSALLQKIPRLELQEIKGNTHCCGAAGTHMMTQPQSADQLLESVLDAIQSQAPDTVVTTNIGCALHLSAGLRRRGLTVSVQHPLTLLARQL